MLTLTSQGLLSRQPEKGALEVPSTWILRGEEKIHLDERNNQHPYSLHAAVEKERCDMF